MCPESREGFATRSTGPESLEESSIPVTTRSTEVGLGNQSSYSGSTGLGSESEPPLPQIEGYEVLKRLGRGGMGVVYQARDCKLDRIVALKMILNEREHRAADLRRFLSESELIAKLQHPNIVQIYGLGQHNGRLYFAMEFVPGGNLAERINGTPWPSPIEAAALVESMACAVHHAHTLGIVHRDLKPANILLAPKTCDPSSVAGWQRPGYRMNSSDTPCPEPKITDFGLAKLLHSANEVTQTGELLGTPSYMAPEIAAGQPHAASFAMDVYGLGAILYHLLTGQPPHRGVTVLETLERVKSAEPPAPRSLNRGIPLDLETICLKCLQKEPAARYPTAEALADDLRRFLEDEPISARPVTSWERAFRWCRKNRIVASLAAAALVFLFGGLLGMTLLWGNAVAGWRQAVAAKQEAERHQEAAQENAELAEGRFVLALEKAQEAAREREEAAREAKRANQALQLLAGLFRTADPLDLDGVPFFIPKQVGENLTSEQLLERALDRIKLELQLDELAQAKLEQTIGQIFLVRGKPDKAEGPLLHAVEVNRRRLPPDHPDLALSIFSLGSLHHERGRYEQAHDAYKEALGIQRSNPSANRSDVAMTMFRLAWLLTQMEEYEASEKLYLELIEYRQHHMPNDLLGLALAQVGLGALYLDLGDFQAALRPCGQALIDLRKAAGGSPLTEAMGQFQQAMIQRELLGNFAEAEVQLTKCVETVRRELGPLHPFTGLALHERAMTLWKLKKFPEAERDFVDCMKVARTIGLQHPKIDVLLSNFGLFLHEQGRPQDVDALFDEVRDSRIELLGASHHLVADLLMNHGLLLAERNDRTGQEARLREALDLYRQASGSPRRAMVDCLYNLALCLGEERAAEAEQLLLEAAQTRRSLGKGKGVGLAEILTALASARMDQQKFDDVEGPLREALKLQTAVPIVDRDALRWTWMEMSRWQRAVSDSTAALESLTEARKLSRGRSRALFEVACGMSECITDKASENARLHARNAAIATLNEAVAAGFRNKSALQTHASLQPLRSDPAFQAVLDRLPKPMPMTRRPG